MYENIRVPPPPLPLGAYFEQTWKGSVLGDAEYKTSSNDSFTILGLWVLGLAVSHINESNCKIMSPEEYFNDKSAILLHPGTR